jgi:pseudouridine kinase
MTIVMSNREQQVLTLIRDNPMLQQQAIATKLGISRSAVAGHVMNLTNKGVIKGRGYVLNDAPFVTVVGGANIDIHGKSDNALRGRDSNPGTVLTSAGGVARNIAENLARLGVDSRLISAVGNDNHGKMLIRLSRDAGIDMQYVHEIASAPTSTYLSVLDDTGDMQVGISDMSIIERLSAERLRPQQAMLQRSSLIVADCNLPDDTLAWLNSTIVDSPIFVDTVSTTKALRIRPYLASIHTLKTSAIEAEALTGLEARTLKQLPVVAKQLHDDGVKRIFITRGEQGVFYSTGDTQGMQKSQRVQHDMHNAGGAGDAFLAGLAYSWLAEWTLDKSLRFAMAAAELTLAHAATSNPTLSIEAVQHAMEMQSAR